MEYFNCRIKYYDDTHFSITTYNYQNKIDFEIEKEHEFNQIEIDDFEPSLYNKISDIQRSIMVSRNRAKNMIYDYARSNDFEYFVTITFNPDKVNSFDYSECAKKLSKWINNFKARYSPDLAYLFVPELHKSGRYHFHGLIANIGNMDLLPSGKFTVDGQPIYNIGNYKLGFTTATKILDKSRTANYIGKYITKELSGHLKNKKHYWVSRNLNIPRVENLTVEELNKMGIDKDFLINNATYHKEVEYDLCGVSRRVNYYEFERGKK